jgi:hypothetical protein
MYGPAKQEITEGWKKFMRRSFIISPLHQAVSE